jgi:hypothetical protein
MEDDWEKERSSRAPIASESIRDAYREAILWRGISRRLVEVFERDQREMREEVPRYL